MHGPARVVLVGDGGAEERHDAVAEELVDRALVAVHLGQHEVEGAAHEPVHLLGVEALGQRGEPRDVHEEHGHLLALALERAARREDLLGQVLGRVGLGRGELAGGGPGPSAPPHWWQKRLPGGFGAWQAAQVTLKGRAATAAEAGALGILLAAARTGQRAPSTNRG